MRSILEELFYGNICPNTDCRSNERHISTNVSGRSAPVQEYNIEA